MNTSSGPPKKRTHTHTHERTRTTHRHKRYFDRPARLCRDRAPRRLSSRCSPLFSLLSLKKTTSLFFLFFLLIDAFFLVRKGPRGTKFLFDFVIVNLIFCLVFILCQSLVLSSVPFSVHPLNLAIEHPDRENSDRWGEYALSHFSSSACSAVIKARVCCRRSVPRICALDNTRIAHTCL